MDYINYLAIYLFSLSYFGLVQFDSERLVIGPDEARLQGIVRSPQSEEEGRSPRFIIQPNAGLQDDGWSLQKTTFSRIVTFTGGMWKLDCGTSFLPDPCGSR